MQQSHANGNVTIGATQGSGSGGRRQLASHEFEQGLLGTTKPGRKCGIDLTHQDGFGVAYQVGIAGTVQARIGFSPQRSFAQQGRHHGTELRCTASRRLQQHTRVLGMERKRSHVAAFRRECTTDLRGCAKAMQQAFGGIDRCPRWGFEPFECRGISYARDTKLEQRRCKIETQDLWGGMLRTVLEITTCVEPETSSRSSPAGSTSALHRRCAADLHEIERRPSRERIE